MHTPDIGRNRDVSLRHMACFGWPWAVAAGNRDCQLAFVKKTKNGVLRKICRPQPMWSLDRWSMRHRIGSNPPLNPGGSAQEPGRHVP
jgi:hypothetical protein